MTETGIRPVFLRIVPAFLVLVTVAQAFAGQPEPTPTLAVFPPAVQLDNARDPQRIVIVKTLPSGVTVDVTAGSQIAIEPPSLATWTESLRFQPAADGEGTITIAHEGQTITAPIKVQNVSVNPAMSFRNDIEAVLMRAGCNSGACHGAASGKNGFGLSLFGYDPGVDYRNLTREARGRRLNVAAPAESLMLQKPTGAVDHEGGARFAKDSFLYNMLHRWIAEGAQDDQGEIAKLTGIEILPGNCVMEGAGAQQRFVVLAKYSDGTDRDVTDLAILASEDPEVVAIDEAGLATAGNRGEIYLMARYGTFAVISQVINVAADATLQWPEGVVAKNYIDEFIYDKLRKLRIAPAEPCSDEVFVRRVYLDILGLLPSVDETRAFLSSQEPDKRAMLIDELLERPEFSELWAMKWAEVLRVKATANVLDPKGMHRYNDWLRQSIINNKPIDQLVRELLTAEGGNFTSPAANFYLVEQQPEQMAENVAQVFMGIQIKCAQCHNHPFERWTMDDYYSFSAFFAQVGRKGTSDPRESVVFNRGGGEVKNLRDGQVMQPKFLGGAQPDIAGRDRREVLAEWITSPDNPWFAENIANRVWDHFFGAGIIDPPDDVRVSNPPSNAALLEELGRRLVENGYDMRKLVRDICNSNTYQLDTTPRDPSITDTQNFAFAQVRRLPSEMLLDAISTVTKSKVKFASLPLGARAVEVAGGSSGNYFLDVFGRPTRDTACTCERRNEPTLAQTLHLINGDTLQSAINAENGRLATQVAEEKPTEAVVEELYLAAYARPPAPRRDPAPRRIRRRRTRQTPRSRRRLLERLKLKRIHLQPLTNLSSFPRRRESRESITIKTKRHPRGNWRTSHCTSNSTFPT